MKSKATRSASLSGSARKALQKTEDGVVYEDGVLRLPDGREMAWRWWGDPDGTPLLRIQGTPSSRIQRNPDPAVQRSLGARYLMAALAARHPDVVSAMTVVVGGTPLVAEEVAHQVGVNARAYELAEQGWQPLYEFLVQVRERLLSDEGMQGVLSDAPEPDRKIMSDPRWQKLSRENLAETLRQGAEGWTDESFALHGAWDFDPADVKASVTWWHGNDDKNAPLSAARRLVAKLDKVDMRIWHDEGHFASLTHDKEIVQELLSRSNG